MTFVAYTNCETSFRHFTDLNGVDLSFDRKFIEYIIKERTDQTKSMKEKHQEVEQQIAAIKQQAEVPAMIDFVMDHNRKVIVDQMTWAKRITTAECALNGELVRDVMFFEDIEKAVDYTIGASRDLPQPQ